MEAFVGVSLYIQSLMPPFLSEDVLVMLESVTVNMLPAFQSQHSDDFPNFAFS